MGWGKPAGNLGARPGCGAWHFHPRSTGQTQSHSPSERLRDWKIAAERQAGARVDAGERWWSLSRRDDHSQPHSRHYFIIKISIRKVERLM